MPGAVGHPLQILLADDNSFNQFMATTLLQRIGHRTVIANNGRGAVDLVLIDIQLPGSHGLTATAEIRWRMGAAGCHVLMVAMTARDEPKPTRAQHPEEQLQWNRFWTSRRC